MPTWPFWLLFLGVGAISLVLVKWLDDSGTPPGNGPPRE